MLRSFCMAAAAVFAFGSAQASTLASLDLSRYQLAGNYALDTLGEMGLEASAVTYARDRGSLFFVGDEGLGVVEISLTGQTLGSMAFTNWPGRTTHHDAEGLTYLGNGQLVVGEERIQDAFLVNFVNGGSADIGAAAWASVANYTYNNVGMEGLSVDPRDGSFFAVKQDSPQVLLHGTMSFATGATGGSSSFVELFSAASLFGLNSLSDVQTLAPVDTLAGTPAADNLLILSLDSKRLVEIDRAGNVLSSLDLAPLTTQAIEGVTIDEHGVIYLVAEGSGMVNSRLLVLTTPVPEPGALALMLAGLAVVSWRARRRA